MAKKVISDENWNIDYFNFLSVCCCPSVFSIFKKHKNLTYRQSFDLFLKTINLPLSKKDAEWTMWASLYAHDLAVFRQNVCLLENIMKSSLVDLTSDSFKSTLMEIRERVTISGGNDLTNYNFIKLIRNALAHNDELEEKPQLTFFEDPQEGHIKFKIEIPDKGIKVIMGTRDMESLCYALVQNTSSPHIQGSSLAIRTKRLKNSLIGNYFDAKKINRYMQDVKSGGELFDLIIDENQESAITNYFSKGQLFKDNFYLMSICNNKPIGVILHDPTLINIVFPRSNNAVTLATQNQIYINAIYGEIRKNPNVTLNDILTKFFDYTKSGDADWRDLGMISSYFLMSPYSMFLEISTSLTTILTNRDTDKLEEEYKAFFNEGTLHHIRNAMVHGTYFYDFNNNIKIYDGQRKLKFISSLDCVEVLSKTQELARNRWRETFVEKIGDFNEK